MQEADDEFKFTQTECRELGIPFTTQEWNTLRENDRDSWGLTVEYVHALECAARNASEAVFAQRRREVLVQIKKSQTPKPPPLPSNDWFAEEARKAIDEGRITLAVCDYARGRRDLGFGPVQVELLRWIEEALLTDLADHWCAWRDKPSDSIDAGFQWQRMERLIGLKCAGSVHRADGSAALLCAKASAQTHAKILEAERQWLKRVDERRWLDEPR